MTDKQIAERLDAIDKRLAAIHAAVDPKGAEQWERKQRGEADPPLRKFDVGSFVAKPEGE